MRDSDPHRERDRIIVLLLGGCVAVGPLAMDIYLPSLPALAEALATTPALAQATIATYMAGYALAQIVHGPASDRWGRRPVLLAGVAVFTLASLACALAPSITALMTGRALQAVGVAAGMVLARTIIRDLYEREQAARLLALTGIMLGVGPIVAPLIGSALHLAFGWRSSFVFLVLYGALLFVLLARWLPETRARDVLDRPGIAQALRALTASRAFTRNVACSCGGMIGLFCFLASAPVVLMKIGGLSVAQFGAAFAAVMAGNISGAVIAARRGPRWGLARTRSIGAGTMLAAGVVIAAVGLARPEAAVATVAPFFVYMIGFSLTIPQASAGALTPFPRLAGLASSVMGLLQFATAAAAAAAVSALHDGTVRPMAALILVGSVVVFVSARAAAAAER